MQTLPSNSDNLAAFEALWQDLMETYRVQNEKYGNAWLEDGLDARAPFVELSAKFFRLKNLLWRNWDKMQDEKHRARVQETVHDAMVFMLFIARRLDLDFGPVDPGLLKKLVDKT